MDSLGTLAQIEVLYRRVYDLSLRQEACLQAGDLAQLPSLLAEKAETLAQAQALTVQFQDQPAHPGGAEPGEVLSRVQDLLADLVRVEERCSSYVPSAPPPAPPRRKVLAAYGAHKPAP